MDKQNITSICFVIMMYGTLAMLSHFKNQILKGVLVLLVVLSILFSVHIITDRDRYAHQPKQTQTYKVRGL
jgi:hypothetical protein